MMMRKMMTKIQMIIKNKRSKRKTVITIIKPLIKSFKTRFKTIIMIRITMTIKAALKHYNKISCKDSMTITKFFFIIKIKTLN